MTRPAMTLRNLSSFPNVPLLCAAVVFGLSLCGCMSPWFSKSDEARSEIGTRRDAIREKLQDGDRPTLVKQIGAASMLTQARIENIGLVTQLHGTGGKVNSSQQRDKMLDIMTRNETEQPNRVLDDGSTALVVASAFVPPAASKGRELDVLVRLSSHAEGTDLQHGWLLETPLVEMSLLGGEVREGFDLARAQGYIVTEQQSTGSEDAKAKLQGVIVGGARLLKGRDLGITIDAEFADAITMSAIVPAINQRFTFFDGRRMSGVATPRDDHYLEIKVPPRYKHDPHHFINVVLRLGFNESEAQRSARVETLKRQLGDPTTVREACWQLEAIGESSIPILADAMAHPDAEISFYAAHSLAYLNAASAIPRLASLCMKEPAFRAMCLNGLVAIESFEAGDALRELVHAADAEVKYGAVRALRRRDPSDPSVSSQANGDAGRLLEIPSTGPPLVAVSLTQVPEIVVFGGNPSLHIPTFQYVNPRMLVARDSSGSLTISHFSSGEEDQVATCQSDLRSALQTIADVGGTFGDCVCFVRECHKNGYFMEPFAMNPIPVAGRTYQRRSASNTSEPGERLYEDTFINPLQPSSPADSQSPRKSLWNPFSWRG
jgi:uncharacterized Zn ribbon protein